MIDLVHCRTGLMWRLARSRGPTPKLRTWRRAPTAPWSGGSCGRELRLHADTVVSADRIADAVLARLRETPPEPRAISRIPWRGTVVGLIAAAASVILVLGAPRLRAPGASGMSDSAYIRRVARNCRELERRGSLRRC